MSLTGQPLIVNLVLFIVAAAGVWIAGTALAGYADIISDRKKLRRAFVGLVFLATVTELPEIATTFTAAVSGNAPLVLNNMFGGIAMQTAILAVADGLLVRGSLTSYPRKPTHALEAALLIVLLTFLLGICIVGDRSIGFSVGFGSVILLGAYVLIVRFLYVYDERGDWTPVEIHSNKTQLPMGSNKRELAKMATRTLVLRSAIAALTILICGMVLVRTSEAIATQTGLGSSFIGVTVLAAATSLPELSTTIAAARLGAFTMAISNIFGSNLIMLALLLPADILYRGGPILDAAGKPEFLALIAGILVTAIYVVGLLARRKPKIFGMGIDSALVLTVYLGSIVILYFNR